MAMDFRTVFMTNKLKHVEENVNVLSEQLMWLQDFIQTETDYGEKFTKFIEVRTNRKRKRTSNLNVQDNRTTSRNERLKSHKRSQNATAAINLHTNKNDTSSESEYIPDEDDNNSYSDEREEKADTDDNFAIIYDALDDASNSNSNKEIQSLGGSAKCNSGSLKLDIPHSSNSNIDTNTSYETIDASLIFPYADHNQMEIETTEASMNEEHEQSQDPIKTDVVVKKRRNKVRKPEEWERQISYNNRLKGEAYTAKKKVNGKTVVYSVPAKKMGKKCQAKGCKRIRDIHCDQFSDAYRKQLFDQFWKQMNWVEKKAYVASLVDVMTPKYFTGAGIKPRNVTLIYHLFHENGSGERVRVCQRLFRSTFDIGLGCLGNWAKKANANSLKVENSGSSSD